MNESPQHEETCTVCGNEATGGRRFSRIYQGGRPFALCCPMCVDLFQRAPAGFAGGERPQRVIEDLIADLKWKTPVRWE